MRDDGSSFVVHSVGEHLLINGPFLMVCGLIPMCSLVNGPIICICWEGIFFCGLSTGGFGGVNVLY